MGKSSKKDQQSPAQKTSIAPTEEQTLSTNQPQSKPYRILNLTFASKKVLTDFILFSALIIILPIGLVSTTYAHLKDDPAYSELDKVVFSVGPALILMNVLIGVYVYKAIKDPENYKRDEPLKPEIKVGLREENMNKRAEERKKKKKELKENSDAINAEKEAEKDKND